MYQGVGHIGYGAFGIAVPTPLPSQPDFAPDMKPVPPYCGSKFGLQQMLADLGFYAGSIDGDVGPQTLSAARDFAVQHGAPLEGGITAAYCQRLIDVWTAAMQAPPPAAEPAPAPTTGMRVTPQALRVLSRRIGMPGAPAVTAEQPGIPAPQPTVNGGIMGWWNAQSTLTKVAVGVTGAALIGYVLFAVFGKKKRGAAATPNRRRRYRTNKAMGKRARAKSGKLITLKSGKRYGHTKPPKRYYTMGARRPSDYAAPQQYGYPLVFRTPSGKIKKQTTRRHIIAAKGKFAKFKRRYPMKLRRQIARNINKASKRFGVGGKVVKP